MGRDRHDEPLDLTAAPPESPGGHSPEPGVPARWRAAVAIGAALVVGAAAGAAVTEARHDAAEPDGAVHVIALGPLSPLPNGEFNDVTLGLLNSGPAPIEVLGVALDGYFQPADGILPEPVHARPGQWATVTVPAAPDCKLAPSDAVGLRLRTESGARSTLSTTVPNHDVLGRAWLDACGTRDGIDPE